MKMPSRRTLGRVLIWMVVLTIAGIFVWVIVGAQDFHREEQVESDLKSARKRSAYLKQKNAILRKRVIDLKNKTGIERAAREEHGLVKPGEAVYLFPEDE